MTDVLNPPPGPWLQTATGAAYDLLNPEPSQVSIDDLAMSLAWTNRYTGHVGSYSVASHCVLISRWLTDHGHPPEVAMAGLLHDAHEAYVGDLSRPLQIALCRMADGARPGSSAAVKSAIGALKGCADAMILEALGLTGRVDLHAPIIAECDVRILLAERDQLWACEPPRDWELDVEPLDVVVRRVAPEAAMIDWLTRYTALSTQMGVQPVTR